MQQAFWLLGTHVQILADHKDTLGRYDLIEGTFLPNVAIPLHRHTTYSEQLYVLKGKFTIHTESGQNNGRDVCLLFAGRNKASLSE
jgi:hypothetical protein